MWEREMRLVSLKTIRGLLWYDIKIRNDALDPRLQGCPWWWHQEEKLCTSKMSSLVKKLCATVMLVRNCCVDEMNGFVLVREMLIEDYQRPALIWQQDQKRHTGPASPGLLLMMASRIETLHSHHLYLSRETLSTSLVEELCPTVMLVRKLLYWWWWIVSLWWERYS